MFSNLSQSIINDIHYWKYKKPASDIYRSMFWKNQFFNKEQTGRFENKFTANYQILINIYSFLESMIIGLFIGEKTIILFMHLKKMHPETVLNICQCLILFGKLHFNVWNIYRHLFLPLMSLSHISCIVLICTFYFFSPSKKMYTNTCLHYHVTFLGSKTYTNIYIYIIFNNQIYRQTNTIMIFVDVYITTICTMLILWYKNLIVKVQ